MEGGRERWERDVGPVPLRTGRARVSVAAGSSPGHTCIIWRRGGDEAFGIAQRTWAETGIGREREEE